MAKRCHLSLGGLLEIRTFNRLESLQDDDFVLRSMPDDPNTIQPAPLRLVLWDNTRVTEACDQ
jgi:hypothetical protein